MFNIEMNMYINVWVDFLFFIILGTWSCNTVIFQDCELRTFPRWLMDNIWILNYTNKWI